MAFPETGLLDTFSDTEGPPMTGWSTPTGVAGLRSASGECLANAANAFGVWDSIMGGEDEEVFCTVTTATGSGAAISIFVRLKDVSSGATIDGYGIEITEGATDTWVIRAYTNAVPTTLGTSFNQEISDGDSIGLRIVGSTLTAWYKASGGSWTQLAERTDSTYTAAGYIALSISDTTGRVDDFGGGTIYVESGAGVAGVISSGAETSNVNAFQANAFYNSAFKVVGGGGGTVYNESGAGIAGAIAAGDYTLAMADSGAGVAGGVASGAHAFAVTESGAGIAGGVGAGAYAFAVTESGAGIAGGFASGSDIIAAFEAGAAIIGAVASGLDAQAQSDSGYGLAGAVASGAEQFTGGGGTVYNESGAGVAGAEASGADLLTLLESGYSVAGTIAAGTDALLFADGGAAVVGGVVAGADVLGLSDGGAGLLGAIASGADWLVMYDSGYGLANAVASGAELTATGGEAARVDYVRERGQMVDADEASARATGATVAQAQYSVRARGSKVQ